MHSKKRSCYTGLFVYPILMFIGILFVKNMWSNLKASEEVFRHLDNKILWKSFTQILDEKLKQYYESESIEKVIKRVPFNISETPELVCVRFTGRLGNLMYGYAFLYAMARSKGLYPIIPEDSPFTELFNIQNTTLSGLNKKRNTCSSLPTYEERWAVSYDEKLTQVPQFKDANFHGYFQSWKYWIRFEDEIRDVFQFKDSIKKRAVMQLNKILRERNFKMDNQSVVVSVHVRREDYLSKEVIDFGKLTPNAKFFHRAMSYFKKKFKNVFFLVGSTDTRWCKNAFGRERNVHISTGNSAAGDMALLSLANHTITSVGTYGWWIGWMARGITVYYKHIFVSGSAFARDFRNESTEDFIYPGWIPME